MITKQALQALIDENPLASLAKLGELSGESRGSIEKMLKNTHLDDYRNRKIKRLRGDKARKRRDYSER